MKAMRLPAIAPVRPNTVSTGMGMRHEQNGNETQWNRNETEPLTVWNQDGNREGESDDEGCDGHEAILWYGLLHMELQRLAGEEERVDADTARKDHQWEADHHRERETYQC